MKRLIDSTIDEMKFGLLIIFVIIFVTAFFSALYEVSDETTKETIIDFKKSFLRSIAIIVAGTGIIGTLGWIIFLKDKFGGNNVF